MLLSDELPGSDIPTDEERAESINRRISNLIVAEIFSIPRAHAYVSPLRHSVTEALRYDRFHRIPREALEAEPQIQRIHRHLQLVLRTRELKAIGVVPESDEGVRRIVQERAEALRHVVGVRELEDEAAAADAELKRVRRRIVAAASPLHAEADNEALLVDEVAVEVERGGEPPLDHGGAGGDGDGDVVFGETDGVDVVVVTALYVGDRGHGLENV